MDSEWDIDIERAEIEREGEGKLGEWGIKIERVHWEENEINKANKNKKCDDCCGAKNGKLKKQIMILMPTSVFSLLNILEF